MVARDYVGLSSFRKRSGRDTALALAYGVTVMAIVGLSPLSASDLSLDNGDRVVFAGDSITDAKKWSQYLGAYLVLKHPTKQLHVQTEGRGGTTVSDYLVGEVSNPAYEQYDKMVLPYQPDVVISMFGHNGSATPEDYYTAYRKLVSDYVASDHGLDGYEGAVSVIVGPHPKVSGDGKPILGRYEDELVKLAGEENLNVAPIWHRLLPYWTRQDSAELLGGTDAVHIGPSGHILIAHAVATELGWSAEVSSVTINSANLSLDEEVDASVTELRRNEHGGIDFQRLDEALPWAIDEAGRENATTLVADSCSWQRYMLTIKGLAAGSYEVFVDEEKVATLSGESLSEGWNMATLTTGPIWRQCQEVLGRIRDMHGVGRENLGRKGPPWEGVESYKSAANKYYEKDGLRGQALIDSLAGRIAGIDQLDGLVHEAATPVQREFSVRKVAVVQPHGIPKTPGFSADLLNPE